MEKVLARLAPKVNCFPKDLKVFKDNRLLDASKTLKALEVDVASILELRATMNAAEDAPKESTIQIKLRTKDKKSAVTMNVRPKDKMSVVMNAFAKAKKVKVKDLKFIFDGEELGPDETPESLELEGGECIDVH